MGNFRRICPGCGAKFAADANYCACCGEERDILGEDDKEAKINPNAVKKAYCIYCGVRLTKGRPCQCDGAVEAKENEEKKKNSKKAGAGLRTVVVSLAVLCIAGGAAYKFVLPQVLNKQDGSKQTASAPGDNGQAETKRDTEKTFEAATEFVTEIVPETASAAEETTTEANTELSNIERLEKLLNQYYDKQTEGDNKERDTQAETAAAATESASQNVSVKSVIGKMDGEPDLTDCKEVALRITDASDREDTAHKPENLLTDDLSECWQIRKVQEDGSTFVEFELEEETAVKYIVVRLGDWRSEESFEEYGAPNEFWITCNSGIRRRYPISDRNQIERVVTFTPSYNLRSFRIEVTGTDPGTKYTASRIASIKVYE